MGGDIALAAVNLALRLNGSYSAKWNEREYEHKAESKHAAMIDGSYDGT